MQDALAAFDPLFLEDLERHAPPVFARIASFRAQEMRRLSTLLQQAQAAGEVRADVRADLATDLLIALLQETGRPKWLRAEGIGFAELLATVETVFLHGVCGGRADGEARQDG